MIMSESAADTIDIHMYFSCASYIKFFYAGIPDSICTHDNTVSSKQALVQSTQL